MTIDYPKRSQALQEHCAASGANALLIEKPIDIFYLTGCNVSAGSLLTANQNTFLIVDGRYIEYCRHHSPFEVLLKEDDTLPNLLRSLKIDTLAFDANATTLAAHRSLAHQLGDAVTLMPLESPTAPLRSIKDAAEQEKLAAAARLCAAGYDHLRSLLRVGITERQLAAELHIFWLRHGGGALSFEPIIAFGPHSALPHHRPTDKPLQNNEIVLVDIGIELDHYQSDMTRTFFFGHAPDPRLEEIFDIVAAAQQRAQHSCRAALSAGDLDAVARSLIAAAGYGPHFSHSLGHGIGLATHEHPFLRDKPPHNSLPLQAGMAITIEPGIYLPGVGGVRLENSVIVTEQGCRDLTQRPL